MKRWRVHSAVLGVKPMGRSWLLYGRRGSAQMLARFAWTCFVAAGGEPCPAGLLDPDELALVSVMLC